MTEGRRLHHKPDLIRGAGTAKAKAQSAITSTREELLFGYQRRWSTSAGRICRWSKRFSAGMNR